ncbi:MAG TPA: ABC transporter permease, partial [Chloroflexota bacterium]|nr:ABC transporter permease [Chloroflexota bacterium]
MARDGTRLQVQGSATVAAHDNADKAVAAQAETGVAPGASGGGGENANAAADARGETSDAAAANAGRGVGGTLTDAVVNGKADAPDDGVGGTTAGAIQGSAAARDDAGDPFALLAEVPVAGAARWRLVQTIPSAFSALRANKGRSILTTLGIIIGVAAVIAIVALGEGASASVSSQLAGLGTNLLTIQPGSTRSGGAAGGAGTSITLKAADADAIAQKISGLNGVSPVVSGNSQIIAGAQNWSTRVQAVAPQYLTINDWKIDQGTVFTDQDNTNSNNVAVLGQTVATSLFPNGQSPIGQLVRIRNVPFTIIGTLVSKGSNGFQDQDDTVMIPFQTGQVRLFGANSINQIVVQ